MFNSIISSTPSFSSISSSAFLAEEGIVWSKGGSFDLLEIEVETGIEEVKALIEASEGYEFTPRRYNGAAALFISTKVITLDWDLDETQHVSECIVEGVDSLKDIEALLEQDIEFHPTHVWELQRTRSGYHAVLLTECEVPIGIRNEWMLALGCDPLYVAGRKGGLYDWRVTPKFDGDLICLPLHRIGEGETLWEYEELLNLYYTAVEVVKNMIQEDSEFLHIEEEWVDNEYAIERVDSCLSHMGYVDWHRPMEVFNPFIGDWVYSIRAYHEDKPDWWQRVTVKL